MMLLLLFVSIHNVKGDRSKEEHTYLKTRELMENDELNSEESGRSNRNRNTKELNKFKKFKDMPPKINKSNKKDSETSEFNMGKYSESLVCFLNETFDNIQNTINTYNINDLLKTIWSKKFNMLIYFVCYLFFNYLKSKYARIFGQSDNNNESTLFKFKFNLFNINVNKGNKD